MFMMEKNVRNRHDVQWIRKDLNINIRRKKENEQKWQAKNDLIDQNHLTNHISFSFYIILECLAWHLFKTILDILFFSLH